ncbi:MAG: hypothetical protein LBC35_01780 [Coriobacteriales bacterium]|nr:hypothetical protein [Coriobacteriales bacterium]
MDMLNMMYDLLALYINYFMPSQRLVSKMRDGSHFDQIIYEATRRICNTNR